MSTAEPLTAELNFISRNHAEGVVVRSDLREPFHGEVTQPIAVQLEDARSAPDLNLHTSGFQLLHSPSKVQDFYNCDEVIATYYEECSTVAKELTGAHKTFTFDHIIREAGKQYNGGGTDGSMQQSGVESGGGYIGSVHMDYTDRTTWDRYLAVHGESVPSAEHVYALNFWRPLSESVDDNPLAICDARTVEPADLLEVDVYGYGAPNYSWHDIGIETFSVSASDKHRWYYYSNMTPADVLVIKSYDSAGVIGTTCPHGSFVHPSPRGIPRRSIELRVLCFCNEQPNR